MNRRIIFAAILALVAAALILVSGNDLKAGDYERQSTNKNSVRVDVLPVQLESGKAVKFDVKMNTHSVEIDNDLMVDAVLRDNNGKEYKPSKWGGSSPGHHVSGILEFPVISGAESVTLIIRNVSKVPERKYEWEIK